MTEGLQQFERFTASIATALVCCVVVAAQTDSVRLDVVFSDSGTFYHDGRPLVFPKHSNPLLQNSDTVSTMIPYPSEPVRLGALVHLPTPADGWAASVAVPVFAAECFHIVKTSTSWRCTDLGLDDIVRLDTTISYYTSTYPASGGFLVDDTGGNQKPIYTLLSAELSDMRQHGAEWLQTPATVYARKTFVHSGGQVRVGVQATGAIWAVYVDSAVVGFTTQLTLPHRDSTWYSVPLVLPAGEHLVALRVIRTNDSAGAFLRAGIFTPTDTILTDTSWLQTVVNTVGWIGTAFNDSAWPNATVVESPLPAVGPLASANCLWPTRLYFCSSLSIPMSVPGCSWQAVHRKAPSRSLNTRLAVRRFDLQGRQLGATVETGVRVYVSVTAGRSNTLSVVNGVVR